MHHQMLIVMRSADLRTLRLGRMCSRAFFSAPELPLLRAAVRHSALGSRDLGSDARRPGSARGWCAVHAAILRSREAVENTDIMGVERRLQRTLHLVFAENLSFFSAPIILSCLHWHLSFHGKQSLYFTTPTTPPHWQGFVVTSRLNASTIL